MIRPIPISFEKFRIMAKQGMLILLLAVILAVFANTARPRSLPLFAPPLWKQGVEAGLPTVSIEEAERLFAYKKAVFIDARPPELYDASHIRGARNIPEGSGERFLKEALSHLPKDSMLIIYCDDQTSAASRSLARELAGKNKAEEVRILLRGWDLWITNELPIEARASEAPKGKAG